MLLHDVRSTTCNVVGRGGGGGEQQQQFCVHTMQSPSTNSSSVKHLQRTRYHFELRNQLWGHLVRAAQSVSRLLIAKHWNFAKIRTLRQSNSGIPKGVKNR